MSDLAVEIKTVGSDTSLLDRPVVKFLDGLGPDFLGYRVAEILSLRLVDLVHPGDISRLLDLAREGAVNASRTMVAFLRLRTARGSWCWTELRLTQRKDPGYGGHKLEIYDATERHTRDAQLQSSDLFDLRTGLPGPELFAERVASAEMWAASEKSTLGIVLLGVAPHPQSPSTGAAAWERAIARMAERVVLSARVGDSAGHVGPDAFGVLCEGLQTADDLRVVCERLRDVAAMTFVIGGSTTTLPIVVGGATNGCRPAESSILLRAERALAAARHAGSGSIRQFESDMHAELEELRPGTPALSIVS